MIHFEDYEKESDRDFIYLQEERHMVDEWWKTEFLRKDKAKIFIIDKDKILENVQYNLLPF